MKNSYTKWIERCSGGRKEWTKTKVCDRMMQGLHAQIPSMLARVAK